MKKGNQKTEYRKEVVEQKEIIRARIVDVEMPCGKCHENARSPGSKHCKACSHEHKMLKINDGRLREKINKQIFKK